MNLPEIIVTSVATKITEKTLEKVSPLLKVISPGQPTAFDQWMIFRGNQRLEALIQYVQELEADNQNLRQTISELGKMSPGSGYTKTLQEYITTPLDEKVELLRNALLNGLYRNYSIELREQFYKIATAIQPLDIKILSLLCKACIDYEEYLNQKNLFDTKSEELNKLKQNREISDKEYQERYDKEVKSPRDNFINSLSFSNLEKSLEIDKARIQSSIERLISQGLLKETNYNTWGQFNPYFAFAPLSSAKGFLDFVSDPGNILLYHSSE